MKFHQDIITCLRAITGHEGEIVECGGALLDCPKGCGPLETAQAFHIRGWFNGHTAVCPSCHTLCIWGTELKAKPKR